MVIIAQDYNFSIRDKFILKFSKTKNYASIVKKVSQINVIKQLLFLEMEEVAQQ